MLRPSKHSNADLTVVAVSTFLLNRLRSKRLVGFVELRSELLRRRPLADELFMPAVSLLYLLGLVEYRQKGDALEYVGRG